MLNLDTHILLFALSGELTNKERALLEKNDWSIAAIVLWEIEMLSIMGRIQLSLDDPGLVRALEQVHVWPLTRNVARLVSKLDFKSDPADQLIAATSLAHDVLLLTRDKKIRRSKLVPLA